MDSIGNSGGILTVWNSGLFKLSEVVKETRFVAVCGEWRPTKSKCRVINVYAP